MNLVEVNNGETVIIKDLNDLNENIRQRLNNLGVLEGTKLNYKCNMPFGGPCMLIVGSQKIGIRLKEASYIKVKKV